MRSNTKFVILRSDKDNEVAILDSSSIVEVLDEYFQMKTLQSKRLLQGMIKQREIDFSCDIYNTLGKLNVASKTVLMNTDDLYSSLPIITSILQF